VGISGVTVTLDPATQPVAPGSALALVVAIAYPLATWAWTFGLVGLALRFLSAERAWVRYVADSSYWIYLIHLPILMVVQILVLPLPLPALVKFALVLAVAFPIMPLSYHLLVRSTWLGALLNGRRYPRRGRARGEERALATAGS
jgi:peptidoglycan/LPS O-acetylase OafA/YrhL